MNNRFQWMRIVLILSVLLGNTAYAGGKPASAFSGEGSGESADDPYIITNAAQLQEMRDDLDGYYLLAADIDLEGFPWEPVGKGGLIWFEGHFDGGGHIISNLTLNESAGVLGLFGSTSNQATIRNVGLVDVRITGTGEGSDVGALVGSLADSTVANAYVTGMVAGADAVGGLVGHAVNSIILSSYADVAVHGQKPARTGALLGYLEGDISDGGMRSYYASDGNRNEPDDDPLSSPLLGTGLLSDEMRSAASFADWTFTGDEPGDWRLLEGRTYPVHKTTFDRLTLNELTVEHDEGTVALTPAFARGQLTYSGRVTKDTADITVTVNPGGSGSNVMIDAEETLSKNIPLAPNNNTIEINVSTDTENIALPGTADDPFELTYTLVIAQEDGSEEFPYSIETADQLAAIGTGAYEWDDHYTLLNDIDLAAAGYDDWEPIGSEAAPFAGVFDGGRHVIRHLTVNRADGDHVGLFGVSEGVIRRVGLADADVTGGSRVGSLIGSNKGEASEVYATGAVSGDSRVGGLIGYNDAAGSVTHAYFAGSVDSPDRAGGLIGGDSPGTAEHSYWDEEAGGLDISGGGEGKTTAEMQTVITYDGWNFADDWALIGGTTYPMWKTRFDAVKLSSIVVTPSAGIADWGADFASGQGAYDIELERRVTEVEIEAIAADSEAAVTVHGQDGTDPVKVAVSPGINKIAIVVADADGYADGIYRLNVHVPAPVMPGLTLPADGYYTEGDTLTFVVAYEDDAVVTGEPRLPIAIGENTAYAVYAGKADGQDNKLRFEYVVGGGLEDSDGIDVGSTIELPDEAGIAVAGQDATLTLPALDASGVKIDSAAPAITLTPSPAADVPTSGPVTVAAGVVDGGSGIAGTKWAAGSRAASYFATGGDALSDGEFQADTNGTYTVYAADLAGNETVASIVVLNIDSDAPTIVLTQTPDGGTPTSGPVTVTADVYDGDNGIAGAKWATGSRAASYFSAEGEPLDGGSFRTDDNGTFTVYAVDTAGNETVEEITIGNIDREAPTISLVQTPDADTPTSGPVTVTALVVDSGSGVAGAKWATGSRAASYFSAEGETLDGGSFRTDDNGTFTVYAVDSVGNASVEEIRIANIETPMSPRPNRGGGSTSVQAAACLDDSCLYLPAGQAGHFAFGGMTVVIPAGATSESLMLTIDTVMSPPSPPEGAVFASPVFEVLKTSEKSFLKPVELRIEYRAEETSQDSRVSMYFFDEASSQWVDIGGSTEDGFTFVSQVDHFTKFAVLAFPQETQAPEPAFSDTAGHWARDSILEAVRAGIIAGYPDGSFRPDRPVTRAEFAAMLASGFGWNSPDDKPLPFADALEIRPWAVPAIRSAAERGILYGYPDGTVKPDAPIAREEAAAMIARAAQLSTDGAGEVSFADAASIAEWAMPYVVAAAQEGIVLGDEAGRFRPEATTTRAEATVIVLRAMAADR